jgi:hypothetical protein
MSKPPPPPKAPPKAPPAPKAPAPGGGGEPKAQPKALLGSIEGFKKGGLKKVQTVDKSGPLLEKPKNGGGGGGPLNIPMAAPGGPPGRKNAPAPPSAGK